MSQRHLALQHAWIALCLDTEQVIDGPRVMLFRRRDVHEDEIENTQYEVLSASVQSGEKFAISN